MTSDAADAYEKHAEKFLRVRDDSRIGADLVRRWAESLPPDTEVLEIGCGGGLPITQTLLEAGLKIWAMDASPTMLARFKSRFPHVPTQCSRIQGFDYFGRQFGAVVCIGLIFLLGEAEQLSLIERVSKALRSGGQFLFSAPVEIGTWNDLTTGIASRSLGQEKYEAALTQFGFRLIGRYDCDGNNNHFRAERT